jgi:hypothetical protein
MNEPAVCTVIDNPNPNEQAGNTNEQQNTVSTNEPVVCTVMDNPNPNEQAGNTNEQLSTESMNEPAVCTFIDNPNPNEQAGNKERVTDSAHEPANPANPITNKQTQNTNDELPDSVVLSSQTSDAGVIRRFLRPRKLPSTIKMSQ